MTDEVDLEELEARLYSQVYHGSAENEVPENNIDVVSVSSERKMSRYSVNNTPESNRRYYSPIRPSSQFRNNRFVSNQVVSLTETKSANQRGNPNIVNKSEERRLKRKERKKQKRIERAAKLFDNIQECLRRATIAKYQNTTPNTVVCISDSDDEGSEKINYTNNTKSEIKVRKEKVEISSNTVIKAASVAESITKEEDDDVILIEPEPVEVIDLDSECDFNLSKSDQSNNVSSSSLLRDPNDSGMTLERKEDVNTPDDDFLDNTVNLQHIEFNFQLHGSDFRDSEFVKPANPNDAYETESSCSTSDFNKDTTNTLKTVFNEVEFPKEDMFADNLETFSNYITPKRSQQNQTEITSEMAKETEENTNSKRASSPSDSSSESDYEQSTNPQKKKLPNLSDMQCEEDISNKNQSTPESKCVKQKNKRKLDSINQNENVSTNEENGAESNKKRKKNSSDENVPENENLNNPSVSENVEEEKNTTKSDCTDNNGATIDETLQNTSTEPDPQDNEKSTVVENMEIEDEITVVSEKNKTASVIVLDSSEDEDDIVVVDEKENTFIFDDLKVVDEVGASSAESDHHSISSDSDCDLDVVGTDLELGNCSSDRRKAVDFDVEKMHENMSDNPENWRILPTDKNPYFGQSPRGRRCRNCGEHGHIAVHCNSRSQEQRCSLCASSEHSDVNCRQICFQCGNTMTFKNKFCTQCIRSRKERCTLCRLFGHNNETCPDLWRRYHLTTEEGPLVETAQNISQGELWCSGCANVGHLQHVCPYIRPTYPPADPQIHSYENVYPHQSITDQPISNLNSAKKQRGVLNPFAFLKSNVEECESQNFDTIQNPPAEDIVLNPHNVGVKLTKFQRQQNQLFISGSSQQLQDFIRSELHKLTDIPNLKTLRRKLYFLKGMESRPYLNLKAKRSIAAIYKKLNMYLFGIVKLRGGKKNYDFLCNFLQVSPEHRLTKTKRVNLFNAYSYIFSSCKHTDLDYAKCFHIQMFKSDKKCSSYD